MNIVHSLVFLLLFQFSAPPSSPVSGNQPEPKREKVEKAKMVFKSIDGGQTWQDVSKGLPELAKNNYSVGRDAFFAHDNGFWLTAENGIYHSNPNSATPYWSKELLPAEHSSIASGKTGLYAFNYWGGILQRANGTSTWSPVYTNFQYKKIRSIFETTEATVFIGSDYGLFKSVDNGKTWKQVYAGGGVGKLVESNAVLVATSSKGIIRSADAGENWELAISEGGVGIDVARIEGGFAAISFSTASHTRRIRTSYDGGKTWQPIDAGLPGQTIIESILRPFNAGNPVQGSTDSVWHSNQTDLPAQAFITSIIQVGESFFCGHPDGIFKSSDKGKTWKLLLPSIENKVFKLFVSGNVIYAIPQNGGC